MKYLWIIDIKCIFMRAIPLVLVLLASIISSCIFDSSEKGILANHKYNGSYSGEYLNRIAFTIGGIDSGMYCIEGFGYFSNMSVRYHLDWYKFGTPDAAKSSNGKNYGFPRFGKAEITTRFPSAIIELSDEIMPVAVNITGRSPFIPGDPDNSSLPVGIIEYSIQNTSQHQIEMVFSFHSPNFMKVELLLI